MKKFILMALALMTVIGVNAANYTVTVSVQAQIEWEDQKTGDIVARETKIGRVLTFDVVADTPREAEDKVLHRCSNVCTSSRELVQKDVLKNGKLCDKYIRNVPYSAKAELNFNM